MKIPLTDQFLLDIYAFTEGLDKTLSVFFRKPPTMKEAHCSEFYRLKREYERKKAKKQFCQFVYYLKKKGYIKIKNLKGKEAVILTKTGIDKAIKAKFKLQKKKEKRKDGKWIMLIFDIPEEKRIIRNLLREGLYFLGYKILQKSVWVCPYDVLKETEDFIQRNLLDKYIKIFLVKEI